MAQAASTPVIAPAVVQNGLRFETWLASPKIVMPIKSLDRKSYTPITLLGLRVTNLTQMPLRLSPFALALRLVGPDGKEALPDSIVIHGYIRQPQEMDYILLLPGQSQLLPKSTGFFWRNDHLCLAWPSIVNGHPFVYEGTRLSASVNDLASQTYTGLAAGNYRFSVCYTMQTQDVQLRDDQTAKVVKTLGGFWTGDVITPPLTFQLVTHSE